MAPPLLVSETPTSNTLVVPILVAHAPTQIEVFFCRWKSFLHLSEDCQKGCTYGALRKWCVLHRVGFGAEKDMVV